MTPRTTASRPASMPLPAWIVALAVAAVLFAVVPIVALTLRVDWPRFPALVTTDASLTALGLSLRTAAISTVLCVVLGVPLALVLARLRGRLAGALRTVVLLPLVLPPVIGGIALLATYGRKGMIGAHLEVMGIQIAFTTTAVILAQTFVSLPFLVVAVEGALRGARPPYERVAATLGAAPGTVLRRITLPLALPALVSGTILAFARSLGEFGATLAFAGSLQGTTRTLPLEIYLQRETDPDAAIALSFVLVAVAVVVMGVTGLARTGARRRTPAGAGGVGGAGAGGPGPAGGGGAGA